MNTDTVLIWLISHSYSYMNNACHGNWIINPNGMDWTSTVSEVHLGSLINSHDLTKVLITLKGDDRPFSRWLPWKCYLRYTVLITTFYVGLWYKINIVASPMFLGTSAIMGPKLREIIHAPIRKQTSFNFRKDVKFGTDWFDSCY